MVNGARKRPATSTDVEVGQRVRLRRIEIGVSQTALGATLDITFQQVQKCEKGVNQISAGRLYQIAVALGVPISYFFEGVGPNHAGSTSEQLNSDTDPSVPITAEGMKFALAYRKIRDPKARKGVRKMVEALSARERDLLSDRPAEAVSARD